MGQVFDIIGRKDRTSARHQPAGLLAGQPVAVAIEVVRVAGRGGLSPIPFPLLARSHCWAWERPHIPNPADAGFLLSRREASLVAGVGFVGVGLCVALLQQDLVEHLPVDVHVGEQTDRTDPTLSTPNSRSTLCPASLSVANAEASGPQGSMDTLAWYAGTRAEVEARAGPGKDDANRDSAAQLPRQLCILPGAD